MEGVKVDDWADDGVVTNNDGDGVDMVNDAVDIEGCIIIIIMEFDDGVIGMLFLLASLWLLVAFSDFMPVVVVVVVVDDIDDDDEDKSAEDDDDDIGDSECGGDKGDSDNCC